MTTDISMSVFTSSIADQLTFYPDKHFVTKNSRFSDHACITVYEIIDKQVRVPRLWASENHITEIKPVGDIQLTNVDIKLRKYQQDVVDYCIGEFKTKHGAVVAMPTGTGKTVVGLYIAGVLNTRTAIIVHKHVLLEQWIDRIHQFLPGKTVGCVYGPRCELDQDITIIMIQSLITKTYTFQRFGLMIIDECHHITSECFIAALFKVPSDFILGLSATPKRRDNMHVLFPLFINNIRFFDIQPPECKVLHVSLQSRVLFQKEPTYVDLLTYLCHEKNTARRTEIVETIKFLVSLNRHILVLSARKNNLLVLHEIFKTYSTLYIGGVVTNSNVHQINETRKPLIFATFSIFEEGVDFPELDTLVLLTPKASIQQACGRIVRSNGSTHGDKTKLIIDFIDPCSFGYALWNKRLKFYQQQKFEVIHTTPNDIRHINFDRNNSNNHSDLDILFNQ